MTGLEWLFASVMATFAVTLLWFGLLIWASSQTVCRTCGRSITRSELRPPLIRGAPTCCVTCVDDEGGAAWPPGGL